MPRYSLLTLLTLTTIGPPTIAFVWFAWRLILVVMLFIAAITLWVAVSLALARFFAGLVCSLMR